MSNSNNQNYIQTIYQMKQTMALNKQNMENMVQNHSLALSVKNDEIKNLNDKIHFKDEEIAGLKDQHTRTLSQKNDEIKNLNDELSVLREQLASNESNSKKDDSDIIADKLSNSNISYKKAGPFILLT